ncbi:hypothetical protein LJK87_12120 [Paenibacillus sp. P25]|nr:hypothetical protein LJK87_12120 [Paenibacillus sp. P25]
MSLERMLRAQVRFMDLDRKLLAVTEYLIGNVNENGYLEISLEEVCSKLCISMTEAQLGLKVLQSLEPPGVGARDLRECLLLQLEGRFSAVPPLCPVIIRDYLEDVAGGRLKKIAKRLNCGIDEPREAIHQIRTLNPHPGLAYSAADPLSFNPMQELSKNRAGTNSRLSSTTR